MEKEIKKKIEAHIRAAKLLNENKLSISLTIDEWKQIFGLESEKEMYKKAFTEMAKNYFILQKGLGDLAKYILENHNE